MAALAGLSLLAPALLWRGEPTILYPVPAVILIPALFGLRQMAVLIPVVCFFVWVPRLFGGDSNIPKRSFILLFILSLLDVLYLALAWHDGWEMQGAKYAYTACAVNIAWIAALWTLLLYARRARQSFKLNLLVHWAIFMWLAWYAFPFFGELP